MKRFGRPWNASSRSGWARSRQSGTSNQLAAHDHTIVPVAHRLSIGACCPSASVRKRLLAWPIGLALVAAASTPAAHAASLLDDIADRGVLRAGTRAAAQPFAFKTDSGAFAGFSVDLIKGIHRRLAERTSGEVELQIKVVTAENRVDAVSSRRLDLVCGLTTVTWPREREVDFTLPFFVDGTKLLTYASNAERGLDGLRGKRVGVLRNSTTERIMAQTLPSAELVRFDTMDGAMSALESRDVAAISNIGILLEKFRTQSRRSASLKMVPDSVGVSRETMACMVPENESRFRDTVNHIMARMMDGVNNLSGPYADIYFDWFGVDGVLFYPLTAERVKALNGAKVWLQ